MATVALYGISLAAWPSLSLTNGRQGECSKNPFQNSHYFRLVTLVAQKLYTSSLITYIYLCHITVTNKPKARNTEQKQKIIQNDNSICKSTGFTDSSSSRVTEKTWIASAASEITLFCVHGRCSPHDNNPTVWKGTPCLFPKLQKRYATILGAIY